MAAWRWIDMEAESYPALKDLLVMVPLFTFLIPTLRFFLDRLVFEMLGKRIIQKEQFEKTLLKFKESAWKFTYFSIAEMFAIVISYREPWFNDTKQFWIGPGEQVWPDQKIKLKLKILYAFSAGFYAYSTFALILWETRRKDFGVSMAHHVVSLILIVGSYPIRLARVGSMVLALHDASDVFLEFAKMSRYAGSDILSAIFFLSFAIAWTLLRLIYFPLWIIRSTTYEVLQTLDKNAHNGYGPVMYYMYNMFLISLLVLHVYWWVLIWRVLMKQLQEGKIDKDVRSDSEEDEE